MVELRRPPLPPPSSGRGGLWALTLAVGVLAVAAWIAVPRGVVPTTGPLDAELDAQIAAKLLAADAIDPAAARYERVLRLPGMDPTEHGRVALSLGEAFLGHGRYEDALRWFYEAQVIGDDAARAEASAKIVHALEALGRVHQAQAVLAQATALPGDDATLAHSQQDPVVATIGSREIRASELRRALDALPPGVSQRFQGAAGRASYLQNYVAQELLWAKAQKLEIAQDPQVRQQMEQALRQIVISAFMEREVMAQIQPSDTDLKSWYEAHKVQYKDKPYDEVKATVRRAYTQQRVQEASQKLVQEQLDAAEVTLYPERLESDE